MSKEQRAAYFKAYYEQHRDEILARQKTYRFTHRKQVATSKKAYYQKHRKEILARVKASQAKQQEEGATESPNKASL